MGIKLTEIDNPKLRERIQDQIDQEDRAKGAHKPVGRMDDPQRQQREVPPLVNRPRARSGRKSRVVIVVEIISIRRGRCDEDNIISGAKPLRDAIARSLAVDDGDRRIEWEYRTIQTRGHPGTQVLITLK
jgi:hypothetical protein